MDAKLQERYSRQILFAEIGALGQQRLRASSAVLIGCGALGTALANLLVRAGLGKLRIVDRDFVEPSNLQRQTLFEEADAREALPKAVASERRLTAINSDVTVEGVVADLTPSNARELLGGFPLLLDGTDNFETRLLMNDYAVSHDIPWIYAAVVASYGVTMAVRPGDTACLACLAESDGNPNDSNPNDDSQAGDHAARNSEMPGDTATPQAGRMATPQESAVPGAEPTCDTAGVRRGRRHHRLHGVHRGHQASARKVQCPRRAACLLRRMDRILSVDSGRAPIPLPRVCAPRIPLPYR